MFQPQTIVDQAHQTIHTQHLDVGGHRLQQLPPPQQSYHPPTYTACTVYSPDTVAIPIDQATSTASESTTKGSNINAVVTESGPGSNHMTSADQSLADGGTPIKQSNNGSTAGGDDHKMVVEASNPEDDVQWTTTRGMDETGVEDDGQQNSDHSDQTETKRGCCSTASCSDSGVGVNNVTAADVASMTVPPMSVHGDQNGRPESLKRCVRCTKRKKSDCDDERTVSVIHEEFEYNAF